MHCESSWLLQHRQHYLVEKRLEGSCCENAPVRLQAEFGLCTVDGYSNAALLHYGICSHHREISSAIRTFLGNVGSILGFLGHLASPLEMVCWPPWGWPLQSAFAQTSGPHAADDIWSLKDVAAQVRRCSPSARHGSWVLQSFTK